MKVAVCCVNPRSNHFRTYVSFLASRGHDVTVITNADTVDAPVQVVNFAGKIPGYRFMPPGMGLLIRLSRLFRALRSAPFDILDVMAVTPDGVYAAWLWRGPLMLDFWGSDIHRLEARPWWIRRLMPRVVRKAERIHAVSEHMAQVLVTLGADPSRIETFQYGVDLTQLGFGGAPRTSQQILASRGLREF
ncbi:MAG TPA: glycosyltransferase family 4 protein, partial [Coriobacteriia bacterium]